MNDDLAITAEEHHNVSEKASSSSPFSHYDEIITRLQLQAQQQQQQYHQKLEQQQISVFKQVTETKEYS